MSSNSWKSGQADWSGKANWSSGSKPTATDDVIVDNAGTGNPLVHGDVGTINSLQIGPSTGADDAQVNVTPGGTLAVTADVSQRGSLVVGASGTLNIGGTLNDYNANVTVAGSLSAANIVIGGDPAVAGVGQFFVNDGTITSSITVDNGMVLQGRGTITGPVTIESGGTFNPRPSTSTTADPLKTGSLDLEAGSTFRAQVATSDPGGFSAEQVSGTVTLGGDLKVADVGFNATPGEQFEIINNDGTDLINGTFAGLAEGATVSGTKNNFTVSYKGGDGNDVVLTAAGPVCFVTGTRIRTTRGASAVEDLVVGDIAVTASGGTRPIVWIGHREMDCRGLPDVCPVRVAAHAFDDNLPERDLLLSPGHPVLVGADADHKGGHLVPIMCLINGTTIERMPVDAVTYWHVELDEHDILLAEELPAESYLDWGDRQFFVECSDHGLVNPDFVVAGLAGRCRPVALDGPVVEAERRRLDAVFVMHLKNACMWPSEDSPILWK